MDVDLVFEGGGVLGINYVGVLKALSEKGFNIKRCAGTSAGSVISALAIAGYTPEELKDILYNTDFNRFMKKKGVGKVLILGPFLSLMFNNGEYDSEYIETWMGDLLRKKGIEKFKHVMLNGESRLKIVTADITKRRMLIFPDDLQDYGVDPGEYSIARAVRMSCAIPFYFTPVEMRYKSGISYIVDGGLLSTFPIWIFDVEGTPRWPTLGIKIQDLDSNTLKGKTGFISYVMDIIDAPINEDQKNFIRDKDLVRTIVIDYNGQIKSTDFGKVNKYVESLYNNGYKSVMKFLDSWSFEQYKRLFSS